MAKAVFHRNQRVWVESVGAWAVVEKIVPVWAQGFDEPVKISYDVGLGRNFQANELRAEQEDEEVAGRSGASVASSAGPQQMADGRSLPSSPLPRQLSRGGHRHQLTGAAGGRPGGIRP